MTTDTDAYSYVAQNCRDAAAQIIQRKNDFKNGMSVEALSFAHESLIGIDLSYAPLHLAADEEYDEASIAEISQNWGDDFEARSQISFAGALINGSKFIRAKAAFTDFESAVASFSTFRGADLTHSNFLDAEVTGAVFDEANIDEVAFSVGPGLLLASFKNVKNFDSARFYIKVDDEFYKVTGIAVDDNGRLCAAPDESDLQQSFNENAKSVPFTTLLPVLERQLKVLQASEVVAQVSAAQENQGHGAENMATLGHLIGAYLQHNKANAPATASAAAPSPSRS